MPDNTILHLTERQQFWHDHLLACEAAGKTTKDYAREHGLSTSGMYTARKDLVAKGALPSADRPRFVRARLATPEVCQWCIQLPNGASVRFSGEITGKDLTLVLRTVALLP